MWLQKTVTLPPYSRGVHSITRLIKELIPAIAEIETGILHLFIQHTSASLCLNEDADPDVRVDIESWLNHIAPENQPYYIHTTEGPDDMPAHLKSAMLGASLQIPVSRGRLLLGTWQGIYLCEHRDRASGRKIVATIHGQRAV